VNVSQLHSFSFPWHHPLCSDHYSTKISDVTILFLKRNQQLWTRTIKVEYGGQMSRHVWASGSNYHGHQNHTHLHYFFLFSRAQIYNKFTGNPKISHYTPQIYSSDSWVEPMNAQHKVQRKAKTLTLVSLQFQVDAMYENEYITRACARLCIL